jgi:hypothetical protein
MTTTAEKQSAKANTMCDKISKNKMLKIKFKEENPDFTLTHDGLKMICDWSTSFQVVRK